MRIALAQMRNSGDMRENLEKSIEMMREAADHDADLILIPTVNTKAEPSEMFEWELRVQAFQNSAAIAMCNRVGTEGEMDFSGESIVVDANGDVLAKADDEEQILYVDIDLAESRKIRQSRPYTNLRRKEFYEVGVKRSFDTYDTRLLRTSYSRNLQNIRNPLIFL